MDVYRALNADVPQLLFTVMHQSGPSISDEDFTRTVTALQMDLRRQAQQVGEELHRWLQQQYAQQAGETLQKLQRLSLLSEHANPQQVQDILARDNQRLGMRVGTASLLGMQGSAEETFSEEAPADLDLARRFTDGREYLASLGFNPSQGVIHEAWLLFRGSVHYDVMEHVARDRMGIYRGSHGEHIPNVARTSFGTYNLLYHVAESLTADPARPPAYHDATSPFPTPPTH